ncbi:MAG: hypothetical protein PHC51_07100 [bacterium]|nr:hypothetical protein [bacterium]
MNSFLLKIPTLINFPSDQSSPEKECDKLSERIDQCLTARLQDSGGTYNKTEIHDITHKKTTLVPTGTILSQESSERLRALSKLAQFQLRPASQITSHRRLLGPVIVFFKKLTWPIIHIHLKETFAGIQELSAWSVVTMAKQESEIAQLKKAVEKLTVK